jgi:hypothetical protein
MKMAGKVIMVSDIQDFPDFPEKGSNLFRGAIIICPP